MHGTKANEVAADKAAEPATALTLPARAARDTVVSATQRTTEPSVEQISEIQPGCQQLPGSSTTRSDAAAFN